METKIPENVKDTLKQQPIKFILYLKHNQKIGEERKMLSMSDINHIRDLHQCGYKISEIHEKTGADPKTIRKYIEKEDLFYQT